MKSKGQRAAVTTGLMGLCLLFCLAVSVSVVRRCEAAFYDRAAAVASVFPDKASDVMAALKIPSAADLLAGRNILSAYGYNGQLLDVRFIAAEIISVSLLYLLCFFIIAALALGQEDEGKPVGLRIWFSIFGRWKAVYIRCCRVQGKINSPIWKTNCIRQYPPCGKAGRWLRWEKKI